jgi:LAO/AO transport system kinase
MLKGPRKQTQGFEHSVDELTNSVVNGDPRAAGRVLSLIDDRDPLAKRILKRLYARTGRAHIVGVTGSAGTGKSTLIAAVTAELRHREKTVGILSIDPTSPFSGGAFLGDRLRMREHFLDKEVFIRSLATRGNQGGLSSCVYEAAQLLDAMGKEYVLIETIGIGQDQLDVSRVAHTVVVVVAPESGDEIQGMKAGIMEIADLLVINKADLSGAEEMFLSLHSAMPEIPILKTCATKNQGIAALVDATEKNRSANANHRQRKIDLSRGQLLGLIREGLMAKVQQKIGDGCVEDWAKKIAARESDPYTAAETILADLKL